MARRSMRRAPSGLISRHVQAVLYVHVEDGNDYVHIFADGEPELRRDKDGAQWLRVDNLPRLTNVKMAVMNGSVLLTHLRGKPLSEEL